AASSSKLPESVERAVAHATSEIARLDRLVADLLALSGRVTGPRSVSSIGAIIRARADALAPWSSERAVCVWVEGEARASVDPDSVARAVDNLLRNAVEASPRGEKVRVRVEERPEAALVRVNDRGPGVPDQRAAELFEPF